MNDYLKTLSPFIRIALDSRITPPFKLERVIFDYELLYVKAGQALITIRDLQYKASAGDIFLLKPKEKHTIEIIGNEPFHQPHIHFDLHYEDNSPDVKISFQLLESLEISSYELFREDISPLTLPAIPNKFCLRNPQYFESLLFEIIHEYDAKMPYYETQIKGLFIQLWTYIIRELFWKHNPDISLKLNRMEAIKAYIAMNVTKNISLRDLEKEFSMSKYNIIRFFKSTYGMTPIQFHQHNRIEKAKEKVLYSDASLTEIAEHMGFASIHAFSRAFKKIEHVAPSSYRMSLNNS